MSIGPEAARARRPRRGSIAWWVFVALLVVPIAEVAVIISVGRVIGAWPTVVLLLVESALGAWLVKREGRRTWSALRSALRTGRMPAGELADGALVLVGGTLLLTPGFLSDVVGFFAILPMTRPLARAVLARVIERRLVTVVGPQGAATLGHAHTAASAWGYATSAGGHGPTGFRGQFHGATADGGRRSAGDEDVIEGEIL